MSQHCNFDRRQVKGTAAPIYLDLGKAAPANTPTYMAYVRVYLREPRADGLSSRSELETLIVIEDALETNISANKHSTYVGLNSVKGCRDFYFYSSLDEGQWQQQVERAMQLFPSYEYEFGTRLDPEWETYFGTLQPRKEVVRRIQNRRVIPPLLAFARSRGHAMRTKKQHSCAEQ